MKEGGPEDDAGDDGKRIEINMFLEQDDTQGGRTTKDQAGRYAIIWERAHVKCLVGHGSTACHHV